MKKYFEVEVDKYVRNKNFSIYRPASLKNPQNNAVMFIMSKYIEQASVFFDVEECLIFWPSECVVPESIEKKNAVCVVDQPHKEFARFFLDNKITYLPEIDEVEIVNGAYIAKTAVVGQNCRIFPGVYIGGEVKMGNNIYVGAGAKIIGEVHIGNNVVIRENTVIGADGLTTDRGDLGHALTIPQFGSIILEDDVQIGANTVIARGAIDETKICRGAKIDNQVFISHNVSIDEDSFVVGETIMFGSSSVGKRCLVSGNSTLMNAVSIGDDSIVGAGAVVTKSVAEKSVVKGNPAR